MSYRVPKNTANYYQHTKYEKTNITNEREDEPSNYDEENLKDVMQAFDYFDMDHNGKINISELKKALSSYGNTMTEEEIFNIFRAAGINQNNDEDIDYLQLVNYGNGN